MCMKGIISNDILLILGPNGEVSIIAPISPLRRRQSREEKARGLRARGRRAGLNSGWLTPRLRPSIPGLTSRMQTVILNSYFLNFSKSTILWYESWKIHTDSVSSTLPKNTGSEFYF